MPLPRINHFLSRHCHCLSGRDLRPDGRMAATGAAENDMKIYLLMLLIGTLLVATRITDLKSLMLQRTKADQKS
jgi:hypothetical protein